MINQDALDLEIIIVTPSMIDDATTRRCLSQDRQEQLHPTQLLLLGNELEHDHDDNNPQILFIIITRKIIPISPIPVTFLTYMK